MYLFFELIFCRNEKYYTCCDEPYLDITFNITMRRKTLFYTVNIIIPCMGISFLTVLTFYLPSDSGEKVRIRCSIRMRELIPYSNERLRHNFFVTNMWGGYNWCVYMCNMQIWMIAIVCVNTSTMNTVFSMCILIYIFNHSTHICNNFKLQILSSVKFNVDNIDLRYIFSYCAARLQLLLLVAEGVRATERGRHTFIFFINLEHF